MPAIMEHGSENQAKRKRGRPSTYELSMLRGLFTEIVTTRGLQNRSCAIRAMCILHDANPGFEWLVGTKETCTAGSGKLRFAILSELGRIAADHDVIALAREICSQRPRA